MAYSYGRRLEVDNSKWVWTAGVGVLLLAIGLIFNAVDAAQLRDLTSKIADLETRREQLYVKQPEAEAEVSQHEHEYALHWSEGFSSALAESRKNLEDGGSVQTLQQAAQAALDEKDRDLARSTWEEADAKLKASEQIITQILGPPTYYEQLKQKADAVDNGYLGEVQATINAKRNYVANMPQKSLCGSSSTLSYASAVSLLDQAQVQLDSVARQTLRVMLPEGLIDKPLAYDQAQQAESLAISASTTADQLSSQADSAEADIASCDTSIVYAGLELIGAYDFVSAQSYYNQAVNERNLAYSACTVQDFGSVTSHTSSCNTYANWSIDASQPPPPTPVPSNDDDDWTSPSWDGGSGGDGGSGDSWDSGSDDWGGGSDDWGGDDDWGGSDDWGADDGW